MKNVMLVTVVAIMGVLGGCAPAPVTPRMRASNLEMLQARCDCLGRGDADASSCEANVDTPYWNDEELACLEQLFSTRSDVAGYAECLTASMDAATQCFEARDACVDSNVCTEVLLDTLSDCAPEDPDLEAWEACETEH